MNTNTLILLCSAYAILVNQKATTAAAKLTSNVFKCQCSSIKNNMEAQFESEGNYYVLFTITVKLHSMKVIHRCTVQHLILTVATEVIILIIPNVSQSIKVLSNLFHIRIALG